MQIKDRIREIIAGVLEVNVVEILESHQIGDIETWDSIHHLMIVTSLEEELDIQYDEDILFEMTSVAEIISETIKLTEQK